jgi:hypothetical protein
VPHVDRFHAGYVTSDPASYESCRYRIIRPLRIAIAALADVTRGARRFQQGILCIAANRG